VYDLTFVAVSLSQCWWLSQASLHLQLINTKQKQKSKARIVFGAPTVLCTVQEPCASWISRTCLIPADCNPRNTDLAVALDMSDEISSRPRLWCQAQLT
jgi:hypothetical protein